MATILVTEQDPGWIDAVRPELERAKHVVITARDGAAAQKFLVSGRADCAVLDDVVLKMYGLRLLARLASVYRDRNFRIAIMTRAPEEHAQAMQALRLSSDLLLLKPVEPPELLWAIRHMLGEETAALDVFGPGAKLSVPHMAGGLAVPAISLAPRK